MRPVSEKRVIGWREWVGLPDLGASRIKAKIDTGARSSALHVFDLERFRKEGRDMLRFMVAPRQRSRLDAVAAEAEQIDERVVRSSGGHEQRRPVISTHLALLGEIWPIELTLTRRDAMGFRLLVGRQAIRGHMLVDPGRSFVDRALVSPLKKKKT